MEEQADKNPENAIRKVTVRLTLKEYGELKKAFQQTTKQKLSQYVRAILLRKQVITKTRNESLDRAVFEMIKLRTGLTMIGKNINQAVKKLHVLSYNDDVRNWTNLFEKTYAELVEKILQINTHIAQISDTWSPELPA